MTKPIINTITSKAKMVSLKSIMMNSYVTGKSNQSLTNSLSQFCTDSWNFPLTKRSNVCCLHCNSWLLIPGYCYNFRHFHGVSYKFFDNTFSLGPSRKLPPRQNKQNYLIMKDRKNSLQRLLCGMRQLQTLRSWHSDHLPQRFFYLLFKLCKT